MAKPKKRKSKARPFGGNPAPLFGSKERALKYGDKYGGSKSGARADRVKAIRAKYRKADTAKAQAEREAARHATAEGKAEARERERETKAFRRILDGGAYAMKVAPMDGKPLHRRDVEGFIESGWMVFPASQVSGKAGSGLPGLTPMTWNPGDAVDRVLGSRGAARAILVASGHALSRADVMNWRGSGFDVSPAPKETRHVRPVRENPREAHATRGDTSRKKSADHGAMTRRTPSTAKALKGAARVWRSWTGAAPSKITTLELDKISAGLKLPAAVALLGRVKAMVSPDGTAKEWPDHRGPYLVTDEAAKRAWLLSDTAENLEMTVSVMSYLAKKPKFGDSGKTEYVHKFTRPAIASLRGQAGTLTGEFTLTPRGIEG